MGPSNLIFFFSISRGGPCSFFMIMVARCNLGCAEPREDYFRSTSIGVEKLPETSLLKVPELLGWSFWFWSLSYAYYLRILSLLQLLRSRRCAQLAKRHFYHTWLMAPSTHYGNGKYPHLISVLQCKICTHFIATIQIRVNAEEPKRRWREKVAFQGNLLTGDRYG